MRSNARAASCSKKIGFDANLERVLDRHAMGSTLSRSELLHKLAGNCARCPLHREPVLANPAA